MVNNGDDDEAGRLQCRIDLEGRLMTQMVPQHPQQMLVYST